LAAHKPLGRREVGRKDDHYDDGAGRTGGLFCLEVNTQPGMTESSLVPELAAHAGIPFGELVTWMLDRATLNQ
jgi:D-alanine-D-alanine ligase